MVGLTQNLIKMKEVKQKENETRKDYLVRVVINMLNDNGYGMDTIIFDESECDAFCLAEDLRTEFNLTED